LVEFGHEVTVVTESSAQDDHYTLPAGVGRMTMRSEWKTEGLAQKLRANFTRVWRLGASLRQLHPHCVIAFGDTTNLRTLVVTRALAVPVIVSERTDPRYHEIPAQWRWLRRLLYPRADALVVQTDEVRHWAERVVAPSRVHVIPNPVRQVPRRLRPERMPQGMTVISVGRLAPEKDFDFLIRAFAATGLTMQGWQLVILGEGPMRAQLQARIDELGMRDAVHVPGAVTDVDAWLQHASLFVLTSQFEGFPNALLEGMAAGLPCISTDCPSGPRAIIQHGKTGLLVPVGNEDELVRSIKQLAEDETLRSRLSTAARADVGHRFEGHNVARLWSELIGQVAKQNGRVA
jgi:glycosyltransferase involved in cell wall biosynthesis